MANHSLARIELLSKNNFDTWKLQVRAILVKNEVWDYVCGSKVRPAVTAEDAASQAAAANWDATDAKAHSDLILAISPSELKQVKGCETSNAIWTRLHEIYQSQGPARKATLLMRLTLHKMAEDGDMREHVRSFFDTVDKLQEMEIEVNKDLLAIMLLNSLPSSFENFRCAIKSRDDLPTPDALKIKIMDEYDARRSSTKENGQNAMFVRKPYRPISDHHRQEKPKTPDRQKFESRCFKCRKLGHKAAECRTRNVPTMQGAGKAQEGTFMAQSGETISAAAQELNVNRWCLDSGSTSHMCGSAGRFEEMEEPRQRRLNLASSASTSIDGAGLVKLKVRNGIDNTTVNLKDALYVPELRTDLLSVSKITENGYTVKFDNKCAKIRDRENKVILTAEKKNDLYFVTENAEIAANAETRRSDGMLKLWHVRLGHINEKYLKSMAARGIFNSKLNCGETVNPCETCLKGKISRLPFPKASNRSSKILEIIHTDVCGPMRTNSIGGARYFATFIDDHSRWCEVRFIKSKDEMPRVFKEYKALVENQTGAKIKVVQSDNGTEYCNREFDRFLIDQGIKRRLTVTYTPEQNGVAERKNRTLCESARCMMLESNVSPGFWAEAISTANYLRNRCPSSSIDGKTPFELWVGRMPTVNHLRSFGCRAIALNKNPAKGKFEARGRECVFIGYSDVAKAYRVWYPSEKRVEATRDIVFLENCPSDMKYEDFIDEQVLYNRNEQKCTDDWTYVEVSDSHQENERVQECDRIAGDPIHRDEPVEPAHPERRGPGRPRIIRTGLPGRPRKIPAQARQRDEDDVDGNYAEEHDAPEYAFVAETSIREAVNGPDSGEWLKAMKEEFCSHLINGTWKVVNRPAQKNVVSCRMVLRNKYRPDGSIARRKARLVARGFSQRPGLDFRETFAPVARMNSVRMVTAMAVEHQMEMHQVDVTTAYLNGILEEEIYMEVPDFLEELLPELVRESKNMPHRAIAETMLNDLRSGDKVCALNKALYGLKQAGRQWHKKLCKDLQDIGLKPLTGDVSVYTARRGEKLMFVAAYVDDLIIASSDIEWISEIKRKLKERFDLRDLGRISHCLGLEFSQRHGEIFISQEGYTKTLLQRFGMENCNPVATPVDTAQKLTQPIEPLSEAEYPFREIVGCLMYLAVGTRPDISYAVNSLSQFNNGFGKEHCNAVKRILRYLKGTVDLGLKYTPSNDSICGYADADWAGCLKDRKSYTGYAFKIANAATSWESRKQQTVALSSTEAEYMALADSAKEAMHVRRFVSEATWSQIKMITIFNDNQGSQQLAKNPVFHSRTKHIDVRHHFVRDAVENELIGLEYMPSKEMPADVLTKGLPALSHRECIRKLGVMRRTDENRIQGSEA